MVVHTEDIEALEAHLSKHSVGFGKHYPVPCHLQKAYAYLGHKEGDFPVSEHIASHSLSLPMFPEMTKDEVDAVIAALNSF